MTQDCSGQAINYSSHSHVCTGLSQGLPQLHPVRGTSVWTEQEGFQPHHLGNAKTQTKPFD